MKRKIIKKIIAKISKFSLSHPQTSKNHVSVVFGKRKYPPPLRGSANGKTPPVTKAKMVSC